MMTLQYILNLLSTLFAWGYSLITEMYLQLLNWCSYQSPNTILWYILSIYVGIYFLAYKQQSHLNSRLLKEIAAEQEGEPYEKNLQSTYLRFELLYSIFFCLSFSNNSTSCSCCIIGSLDSKILS